MRLAYVLIWSSALRLGYQLRARGRSIRPPRPHGFSQLMILGDPTKNRRVRAIDRVVSERVQKSQSRVVSAAVARPRAQPSPASGLHLLTRAVRATDNLLAPVLPPFCMIAPCRLRIFHRIKRRHFIKRFGVLGRKKDVWLARSRKSGFVRASEHRGARHAEAEASSSTRPLTAAGDCGIASRRLLLPLPFAPMKTFTIPSLTSTFSSDLKDSTVILVIIGLQTTTCSYLSPIFLFPSSALRPTAAQAAAGRAEGRHSDAHAVKTPRSDPCRRLTRQLRRRA